MTSSTSSRAKTSNNMEGWFKIYRRITEHWLWNNAERLKWWFDLLFMAAWEDKKVMHDSHMFVLKRGQIIASISFLVERWERSKPTIIKFLNMLEEDGMITRKVIYRQTPIITICNYEKYQDNDSNDVDTLIDTQVYRQVDTIVYPIKEYKEYKEKKENISTSTGARACDDDITREIEDMKTDISWIESICMKFHLKAEDMDRYFNEFMQECKCNGKKYHQNITDAESHFYGWMRKRLSDSKKDSEQQEGTLPAGLTEKQWKKFQSWGEKNIPRVLPSISPKSFVAMQEMAHNKTDIMAEILKDIEQSGQDGNIERLFDGVRQTNTYWERICVGI